MPPGARRGITLFTSILALCLAPGARADDFSEPIRLEYHAGAGCPNEAAFRTSVRGRTDRARFVESRDASRTFVVQVDSGARAWGRVTVTDEERHQLTRSVQADTCGEVADALGLVVALAIDPHATIAPAAASAPAAATRPESSATDHAHEAGATFLGLPVSSDAERVPATPPAATGEAEPSRPRPRVAPSPVPTSLATTPTPRNRIPATIYVGADLVVATGVAPSTLTAAAAGVGWQGGMSSVSGLDVRASLVRGETGKVAVQGGAADFTWTVGAVDGCVMFAPNRRFRLGPCVRIEAGLLDVTGNDVANANTKHKSLDRRGTRCARAVGTCRPPRPRGRRRADRSRADGSLLRHPGHGHERIQG